MSRSLPVLLVALALGGCATDPSTAPAGAPSIDASIGAVSNATYTDRSAMLAATPGLTYTTIDFATFDDGSPMDGQLFYYNQSLRGAIFTYFATYYQQFIQANPLHVALPPNTYSVGTSLLTSQGPFSPPGTWSMTLSTGQSATGPLGTPFLGAASTTPIDWVEINYDADASFYDDFVYGTSPAIYTVTGFFAPVDNAPVVNRTNAGSAVPVKFSLGGDHGLDVFAAGSPSSGGVTCGSGPADDIEQTVVASTSALHYDAGSGRYTYVWKTEKSWAGACRLLTLRFNDGQTLTALFQFR